MKKLKTFLVVLICILPYKVESYTGNFNLVACKETLMDEANPLIEKVFRAIEQNKLEDFFKEQSHQQEVRQDLQYNSTLFFYYAAMLGSSESIQILISELKIDVDIKDSKGRTALHYAALNENISSRLDTVYFLITAGVDPAAKDDLGNFPSFYVKERQSSRYSEDQGLKIAELSWNYNVRWGHLIGIFQITSRTLDKYLREYRERAEGNM